MFQLITKDENNQTGTVLFDNTNCTMFDSDNNRLIPEITNIAKNPYYDNFFRYKVILGRDCDFRCLYCSQKPTDYVDPRPTKEQVDKLIAFLIKDSERHAGKRIVFNFWGGEPLIYFDLMKYMIEKLSVVPKSVFNTITNGANMTKEVFDTFMKYRLCVTLSHDGMGQILRTSDPFNTPAMMERYIELNNNRLLNFNPTLTKHNYNIVDLHDWFCDKLKSDKVDILELRTMNLIEPQMDIYRMNLEQRQILRNSIFTVLQTRATHFLYLYDKIFKFMQNVENGQYVECYEGFRSHNDDSVCMTVDMFGNILFYELAYPDTKTLLGESMCLGTIDDVANKRIRSTFMCDTKETCGKCPIVYFCRYKYTTTKSPSYMPDCDGHIDINFAILNFAFALMFNKFITEIHTPEMIFPWNLG